MYISDKDFIIMIVKLFLVASLFGVCLTFIVPIAWDFIKPIIHEVTK